MKYFLPKYLQIGLVCCLVFSAILASGQKMNNTLYLMQNVPQSNQLNPAIQPECKVFVGFPALSSIYFNYSNNSFAYSDIIHKGTGIRKDSLIVDINKFHDALKSTNFITQQIDLSLFALGIRAKNFYFTFDIIEKNDFHTSADKEIISFLKDGNYNYRGKTADFGGLGLDANHYREFALGVSKKINDKWTVGVKGKLLFGIANLNMEKSDVSITTSLTGDQVDLRSRQLLNVSLPINQIGFNDNGFVDDINFDGDDFDQDFALNTDNKGLAIDLGATYQMDEKTTLYASIVDLGYINWKTDVHQFTQDATFKYTGADLTQSGNSNAPDYKEVEDAFDDLVDDLKDEFMISDDAKSYRTALPTRLYMGGSYKVSKRLNFGALSRTEIYNSKIHSSLTLSANARVIRNVSTSISYSMVNNTYNNIGVGLATKLGPFQLYMVSDNILAPINPKNFQNFSFRFGLNMLFGCRDKTRQKNSCSFEEERNKKKPLYK
jgi:hypothetical protein